MALVEGAGTSATTIAVAGTSRIDISEFLAANLVLANNVAGALRVGPEFSGNFQVCTWNEDKLNANFVTDTTAGGISSSATQIIVSAADASVTPVGTILCDAGATGGLGGGEQMQVTGVTYSGSTANLQISRAYGGTTASSHAQSAVYTHIARPLQQNSDLGVGGFHSQGPQLDVRGAHDADDGVHATRSGGRNLDTSVAAQGR